MLQSSESNRMHQTIRYRRLAESTPDGEPRLNFTNSVGFCSDELPWLQGRVPNGYWDVRENRVRYLNWLAQRSGFHAPSDWYGARKSDFQKNGGGGLLRNEYRSSVLVAMHDYLPNYEWKPWMFGGAPKGFWKCRENRCRYLAWLAEQLGIRRTDDWYAVTGADFFDNHGGGLLNNEFKGSVQALLLDYRPHYPWKAWCFSSVPQCFWSKPKNRRSYLQWLGEQLGFQTRQDWQQLRREHFYANNGSGVFVGYYHGSTEQALRELFTVEDSDVSDQAAADSNATVSQRDEVCRREVA